MTKEPELSEPGKTTREKQISLQGSAPHTHARGGLTRKALAGVGWLLAQNVGARIISFASQIVLARILAPTDFASLALAGTVTVIFETLINFGVDDVLLQRQKTMRMWATPAFLTSLGLGVVSMLLVIAASPLAVRLYNASILYWILPIMAVGMPLGALSTVPAAKIRAALNFRFLALYATTELFVSQAAVIILALNDYGALSFVLPGPVLAAVRAAVFWIVAKPQLRRMRPKQMRMMGKASSAVFGTRLITAMVSQGGYFVLGLFASKPEVGAYFFAFRLAVQPVQMLAGNLSAVLFPALAQLRYDFVRQREAALSACRVLAFTIMPYCFIQAAVARPLFGLLFGSKWDDAIVPAQILSVGLAFDAVSWIAGALLSARGEFRRAFIYSCIFSPVFFVVVGIGARFASATGVATAVSLFYVFAPPSFSYLVFRRMGVPFRDIAAIYVHSMVFAATAVGVATVLASWAQLGPLAQIGIIVAFGGGLYLGLVRLFSPSIYSQIKHYLSEAMRPKRQFAKG
jgi:O-antigen/teichoic acid export membrane protein